MHILKTIDDIRNIRSKLGNIALVPTMGNLHQGHLSLVEKAQTLAPQVVVSIFVNPLQFAPHEDLEAYPRTLAVDLNQLKALNVAAVFTPEANLMYPDARQATRIEVPEVSAGLCSISRPHFFAGVATVVAKLFNIIQPQIAVFGEKDYQQLLVIQKMVKDLNFPVKIYGAPIIREKSGLAMSSRNQYLSPQGRQQAAKLYDTLKRCANTIERLTPISQVLAEATNSLIESGFKVDYLTYQHSETLAPLDKYSPMGKLFVAAYLENTRLIDNL